MSKTSNLLENGITYEMIYNDLVSWWDNYTEAERSTRQSTLQTLIDEMDDGAEKTSRQSDLSSLFGE